MDSDIKQRLARAAKELGNKPTHTPISLTRQLSPLKKRKPLFWVPISLVVICLLGFGTYLVLGDNKKIALQDSSPVPATVRKSVSFPVYYPSPAKMPAGYTLDLHSFSATSQTVVYSVTYETNKKIAFTVQRKPSDDELKLFHTNQMPLRNEVKVAVGTATTGSLNNQTLASLPTNDQTWLLITAPIDIDQEQFRQVLRAINR